MKRLILLICVLLSCSNSDLDEGKAMTSDKQSFLVSEIATLSGTIVNNTVTKEGAYLEYSSHIKLKPFYLGSLEDYSSIGFDSLKLPVKSFKEIENSSFTFPINPEKGYLDSSIYISNEHRWFDITEIQFGEIKDNTISARFIYNFPDYFERYVDTNEYSNHIDVKLDFYGISIADYRLWEPGNVEEAKALLNSQINIEDFEEPTYERKTFNFKLKL
jgi:hypothetical protein